MATATYDLLDSVTITSPTASVTFSGIDQSYRDLVLVSYSKPETASETNLNLRFNGAGSPYSGVTIENDKNNISSGSNYGNYSYIYEALNDGTMGTGGFNITIYQILDYSVTNKYKAVLGHAGNATWLGQSFFTGRWESTAAVTSITINPNAVNFASGTLHLYGIAG